MSLLKTYEIAAVNLWRLNQQISPLVTNYGGAYFFEGVLSILGDSIIDETTLDTTIAAHDPTPVPFVLTPRQMRLELLEHGITETDVDNVINSLSSPTKEQAFIGWRHALEFKRDDPLLNQVATMLNLTQEDVDQMFIVGFTR